MLKFGEMFGSFKDILYLCITFFIVLDMKVYTRSGLSGALFLCPHLIYILQKKFPHHFTVTEEIKC